jgi:hypothetical protein
MSGGLSLTKEETVRQIRIALDAISSKMSIGENSTDTAERQKDFFEMVEEARREWQSAMDYFNHVVDPGLVDHAIFAMEAAELKYTFLLKKARQEGYRLPVKLDALREGR